MLGVIDIGSNSVRLLLSEAGKTLSKTVRITKLGEGVDGGYLCEAAMERTISAAKELKDIAISRGACNIYAFATEAVRAAKNRDKFIDKLAKAGIYAHILSGEEEAEIGFLGAKRKGRTGIIDIGGASSELVVGDSSIEYAVSAKLGVVRLRDTCGESDERLAEYIAERTLVYGKIPDFDILVGIGGTATTVAAMSLNLEEYDASKVDGYTIDIRELDRLITVVKNTPIKNVAK